MTKRRTAGAAPRPWAWSGIAIAAIGLLTPITVVSQEPTRAYAAGEVITVSPSVASPGDYLTVTVSRINSSSFCDYLPYAGDGYFSRVYLLGINNGGPIHYFPQRSVDFDPRQTESITIEVGPIPDWYPSGQVSVVADCYTPADAQTGNTAIPFILDVVSPGETNTPLPTETPDENTESGLATGNTTTEGLEQDTGPSGKIPRQRPDSPATLLFAVDSLDESGENPQLYLSANLESFSGDVVIELRNQTAADLVKTLTVNRDKVWEPIVFPEDISPGTYALYATPIGTCDPGGLPCEFSEYVMAEITSDSITVLGAEIPRQMNRNAALTAQTALVSVTLFVLGATIIGWGMWRGQSAKRDGSQVADR